MLNNVWKPAIHERANPRRSKTGSARLSSAIRRFFFAISAGVLALSASGAANAQVLPSGCTDGGNNIAEAGETIQCVAASPAVIPGIATTVGNITLNIGDAATPTTVSGGADGVSMSGAGSQTLNILNADSTVNGGDNGVSISTNGGSDLTFNSEGAIIGGLFGVNAFNNGGGNVSIVAHDVTGVTGPGIRVVSFFGNGDVLVSANGSIFGGNDGIVVRSDGGGSARVIADGVIEGVTGRGILVFTDNGGEVIVNSGSSVTGGLHAVEFGGVIFLADPTADILTLNAGGSIVGDIMMNNGDDVFNDAGGDFTKIFGGGGVDTANFSGAGHVITGAGGVSNSVQEFEYLNFNSGAFGVSGSLTGVLATTISAGAALDAADGAFLSGDLTNSGVLNIGNSPGSFSIAGDFVQSSTGVLPVEIGATTHDQLVVSGSATLAGTLDVVTLGGFSPVATTRTIINAASGISGAFDTFNGSGLLINHSVVVDMANSDVNLVTTVNSATSLSGLTGNQNAVGDALVEILISGGGDPQLTDAIVALGGIGDTPTLGAALDELTPESLDFGLKFLSSSQTRFLEHVLGHPMIDDRSADAGVNLWGGFETYSLDQDLSADHPGFDGSAYSFAAGVSGIAAGPLTVGFGGGYSDFDGDSSGALGDEIRGNIFQIGGSADVDLELAGLSARLLNAFGFADGKNEIVMNLTDPVAGSALVQRGETDISSFDWIARFVVDGVNGNAWALRPYLQAGVSLISQDAFTIAGAGATSLDIESLDNTRWQLGIGAVFAQRFSDRLSLRARAAGVQYFDDTNNVFVSRFVSASAASPAFRTYSKEMDRQIQFDVALSYGGPSGFLLTVGGFGEVGDISLFGGVVRLSRQF